MNHSYIHKATGKGKPHLYFLDIPYVLEIKQDKWKLYSSEYSYEGTTKEEFVSALDDLKVQYDLQTIKNKHDKLVIYMEDLHDIHQIVDENRITKSVYDFTYIVDDIFEFVEWTKWIDTRALLKYPVLPLVQAIFNKFKELKDGVFWSPAAYARSRSKHNTRKESDKIFAQGLYPFLDDYFYIQASSYGGLRYCWETKPCEYDMLYLDITSAYTFTLLTDKYPMSKPQQEENPNKWEEYLIHPSKGSIGIYEITYFCSSSYIQCWHDVDGNKLKQGTHTATLSLTSVDLDLFLHFQFMNIHKIECKELMVFDMDYMPEYYRRETEALYMDKKNTPKNTPLYEINKVILNASAFGNLLYKQIEREMDKLQQTSFTEDKIRNMLKIKISECKENANSTGVPQWGVFCTAYTRKMILGLALLLDKWVYTHTDSIVCKNNEYNKERIECYNQFIQDKIRQYCERTGSNFEDLKKLGQFDVEEVKVFRAWDTATYALKDKNDKILVKASGRKVSDQTYTDDIFTQKDYKVGCPIKSKNHEKEIDAKIFFYMSKFLEENNKEKFYW